MHPQMHASRRMVLAYAMWQAVAGAVVALVLVWFAPPHGGLGGAFAALAGAAVVARGTVVFGWRMFRPGIAPVPQLARAWYSAEVLKWLWVGCGLWLALGKVALAPLPVLLGVIAAQIGFWVGLARVK